jgi:hypothetical protein
MRAAILIEEASVIFSTPRPAGAHKKEEISLLAVVRAAHAVCRKVQTELQSSLPVSRRWNGQRHSAKGPSDAPRILLRSTDWCGTVVCSVGVEAKRVDPHARAVGVLVSQRKEKLVSGVFDTPSSAEEN